MFLVFAIIPLILSPHLYFLFSCLVPAFCRLICISYFHVKSGHSVLSSVLLSLLLYLSIISVQTDGGEIYRGPRHLLNFDMKVPIEKFALEDNYGWGGGDCQSRSFTGVCPGHSLASARHCRRSTSVLFFFIFNMPFQWPQGFPSSGMQKQVGTRGQLLLNSLIGCQHRPTCDELFSHSYMVRCVWVTIL